MADGCKRKHRSGGRRSKPAVPGGEREFGRRPRQQPQSVCLAVESYNGKLYVGTFDIGSLAYPLMQVTNGDILKRSPEEWKTQFEYIIKLLELLKSSGSLAARSATGISSMSATLTSMTSLLNQGGIEDLASTEAFYSLLKKVVSLYENLRKYLPDSITEKLDGIFNQDTVDNFYYFIGVCKYLSKGERGFDPFGFR